MILRNHSYCRSILLLTIFIFLLTACSSTSSKPTAVEPSVIQQETESVEDGQTLTVVTPETANKAPEEKSKYQIQTRLTDFHMLSDSEGIAWGLTKTSIRLYLTEDFGETWVDISPSPNINFVDRPVYGQDIVFTDKDHGWIVRNGVGSQDTMLLNTNNGGSEWKLSSLPGTEKVTALSFSSSENGWVMASGGASPGSEEKALFRTNDNGGKWSNIMQNSDYPASRIPGTVIPRTGLIVGMTFANAITGFATVKETQGSKLYVTRDGGTKWNSSKLVFQDDQMKMCKSYIPGVPKFLGSTNDVWVPVTCLNANSTEYLGYFSSDSGESWNVVSFPLKPKSTSGTLSPVFRRLNEGWSMIDGIVYRSENMGKTWTPYPADPELGKHLADYPIVSKMEFASSEVGWMLVETTDAKRSRLLLSMDGGETWRIR
ncbi:Uncharacterized protein SAMN05661091_3300 [Paenibacillus uliginis N3/975]|uniref:Photosynthesis system II assembly factor Ycf48/Hcf136-like domain-containing protein n=1 Tax=Paenibacillus uliginis N3/975 TaxID=1313296 RepID=A0A1X7HGF5_9BACL|nr:YCF48-related protein [Paenibacillus uliginis]SMF86135.1 Uncharacterized protein SAMN05661091_3300 [Paenibacillus uliginis N3/975]